MLRLIELMENEFQLRPIRLSHNAGYPTRRKFHPNRTIPLDLRACVEHRGSLKKVVPAILKVQDVINVGAG